MPPNPVKPKDGVIYIVVIVTLEIFLGFLSLFIMLAILFKFNVIIVGSKIAKMTLSVM